MGRKAKPIDVLVAEGNSHLTKEEIEARRAAEEALKPNSDNIVRPSWLDPLARKAWDVLTKELQALDLLTNVDVYALAIACDAYSKYVQASKAIKKQGLTIEYTNATGATNVIANPNVAIAHKYHQIYKAYLAEFGLSPSSRAALALQQEPEDVDEFGELFE